MFELRQTISASPARKSITPVTAFVDWNSQIHAARLPKKVPELELADRVLRYVSRTIGRGLAHFAPEFRFDVTLRLYHGWLRGFSVTPRRKALITAVASTDFSSLSTAANVLFRNDVHYGDNLISAQATRFHARLGCHLPNTCRKSLRFPDEIEEKMVDTAIASDVVDLAHREPLRWLVIVGDDDDLVPPLYVADGIRTSDSGRVFLIRTRPETSFFKLDNIWYQP